MSGCGPSRHFAASQQIGRFRSEADISERFCRTGFMSTRPDQERRTGVIDKLLDDANKQGDKVKEATPVKDVAPAK
jgi:hypothetical protein